MREILADIDRWRSDGRRVALARLVEVTGSSPRPAGAAMAVNDVGEVTGSVSGGCVEAALVTDALEVLAAGRPRLCSFGVSDDDAFSVGLTCGGTLRVFIEPSAGGRDGGSGTYQDLSAALRAAEPVALAVVVEGPGTHVGRRLLVRPGAEVAVTGSLGDDELDGVVVRDTTAQLAAGVTAVRHYASPGGAPQGDVAVFIESFAPPPRMVIFGAADFTAALARVAKVLGYRVTVCDARPVFATPARFPMADEVVVAWPGDHLARAGPALGPSDALCVLTHDPKFDVPAIMAALATDVGYLGAMGSRRTHADRVGRLRQAGADDRDLARLMAPIGLDIGAGTPEETAVAICAEIIAVRSGRSAPSLRDRDGPIHPPVGVGSPAAAAAPGGDGGP